MSLPDGPSPAPSTATGRGRLLVGGVAAILASTCCLGPLVLLLLGVSGAWIGTLTVLEPYRPVFIGIALIALVSSHRRVFRQSGACRPGDVCALPQVRTTYKALFGLVAVLVLIALAYPFVALLLY